MSRWMALALLGLLPPADAEERIVEYLKAHVKAGERVVVSQLYNSVFTAPDERAALDRLFNVFFKIPLAVAQHQRAAGRPPTLAELAEQFRFRVPGQADLMLRIMEAELRMPRFLERDPSTGEIVSVDVDAILAHPRFGKALERTLAGWEGRRAPAFEAPAWEGGTLSSASLAGRPHLLYFWFTNCPPCLRTTPLLVELHRVWAPRGLEIVGANADEVLGLPYTAEDRRRYARQAGIAFPLVDVSPAMHEAYGTVSVFPTLFAVDHQGTIVRHLVNLQDRAELEKAIALALK